MHPVSRLPHATAPAQKLARIIDSLADLLPAQGPISIFIHHNTLHAFEHLPFEDAVEQAGERLGCEPFLAEERYRDKLASGRILAKDVDVLLAEQLGVNGSQTVADAVTRLELWRAIILHGIPTAQGRELLWILDETAALSRFRTDLPASARATLAALIEPGDPVREEAVIVRHLWNACLAAVRRTDDPRVVPLEPAMRHRDLLQAVHGIDTDSWIHPPLIRFVAGYLDQGLAHWRMPSGAKNLHECFLELYNTRLTSLCGPWARALLALIAEERAAHRDELGSIAHSLDELGVAESEWNAYLSTTLLALPGWAGMVRQIEVRPDRVPAHDVPVTLAAFLAVRLLFERAALSHVRQQLSIGESVRGLRAILRNRLPTSTTPTDVERAWRLFHVAQLCGLDASIIEQWTAADVARVESELAQLHGVCRRRILHEAFERAIRHRLYDALSSRRPREFAQPPAFHAVFCLDEREESFRRHLEEVEPACETCSTAGFFNVAMYHQSASDAHPRPLCPVAIRPEHYVPEVAEDAEGFVNRSRQFQRRVAGFLGYNVHVGSRLPVRGAVLMTAFGWLALIPLVFRVVFPWLTSRWRNVQDASVAPPRTRLQLDRADDTPPIGTHTGYTVPEMTDIVRRVLSDIGIAQRLSPLVLVVGHGSVSLNNPHESAHDCGACGGGRGGPNARAFAQMANDSRVRHLLIAQGLNMSSTWFVGAERNTCNNTVMFFDEDLVPANRRSLFARAKAVVETARRREAHERCRRFDAVPRWYPPLAALAHVQGRAADLAQPRPEYGHATNAYCIIGRRTRTRGLFLDRRAFLVSYDPTTDPDADVLRRVMAAVVPVVAGISLEYYFSYVDPVKYGCGTKLPHNVTSLLGVMDGAQSDLRTGLPWQMVEIHEPTRLTIVVEGSPERLRDLIDRSPSLAQLITNRWIWLACLDAESDRLWEWRSTGFVVHHVGQPLSVVTGDSASWYQGKRGFLPPVEIVGPAAVTPEATESLGARST
jgi:uncharacterized protein YbcC (UPF0753/DUF2309 family)